MADGTAITDVGAVPDDGSFLFTVDDGDEEREAILVRAGDAVAGWLNYCQHFRHINLDKGSGVSKRNGELVCANHGAMFEADTGECTFGPCEGAYLEGVDVTVDDGTVYLTDEGFDFVSEGGKASDPADLTSTSNVEF